jgi:hypothetical protein
MATLLWSSIGRGVMGFPFNVDMIRANDGATRAPHETCLRQAPDPVIGSVKYSFFVGWEFGALFSF